MVWPDKIFLVGMPGSGKSTLGEQLAKKISCPFFDLDQVIEHGEDLSISEIFEDHGETHFRQLEHQYLNKVIREHSKFVMACGGGTPCFHENMDLIKTSGLSVFLDTTLESLLTRLQTDQTRPLVKAHGGKLEEYLQELLHERLPFYQKSHIAMKQSEGLEALENKYLALRNDS